MLVDISDLVEDVYEMVKIQSIDGVTSDEFGRPTPFVLPQFNAYVSIVDFQNSFMGSFGGTYSDERIYEMYIPYKYLKENMLEGALVARSNGEKLIIKASPVTQPYGSHAVFTVVSFTPTNEPGKGIDGFPDYTGPGSPVIPPRIGADNISNLKWSDVVIDFDGWSGVVNEAW